MAQDNRHNLPYRRGAAMLLASTLAATSLGALIATGLPAGAQGVAQRSFDIPAGPLSQALAVFGRQAGLQVTYAPAVAAGKLSSGFSGAAAPEDALMAITQGTGLSWSFPGPGTVALFVPEAQTGGIELPPIVIYGDRTATTLDKSRTSVAVVKADPLDAPQAGSVRDAFRRMGNVSASPALESGFVIRGINSEGLVPGAADAPLASFYIDGVQQTVNGVRRGTRSFFDAEQIEVYRGPQSTLSGRAALAGAMYLRTKDPAFAPSGAAMLSYGSDNHRRAGLAWGDALGENLAYRLSAEWSGKDSPVAYPSLRDYASHGDMTTDEYYTLRGKLLWLPTGDDRTRVMFSLSHSYDRPTSLDIAGPGWLGGAGPSYGDRRGDLWVGLSPLGIPLHAYMENRETRVDNLGVEVSHDISDSLRFTAMTGISRSVTDRASVNRGMPYGYNVPDLGFGIPIDTYTEGEFTQRTISQEFRLNYEREGLKWVGGFYVGRTNNDARREGHLPGMFDMFTPDDPSDDALYIYGQQTRNTVDLTNVALFGETAWEFSPGWSVIGGGRLDWIRQTQTGTTLNDYFMVTPPDAVFPADLDSRYTDLVFLPKLGVEHAFGDGQNVSLIYQQGYRPGGAGAMIDGTVYRYDPEKTRTLELAWRGSFMDGRLDAGVNVFWQKWRNQQVEVKVDPINSYIANAVESESRGAEIELAYAATDALSMFASVGLLHTRFKDFNLEDYGNFNGKPFANAPEQSIALGFRWEGETGLFAAAAAKYVGTRSSTIEQNTPTPVRLGSYVTVDAEIGYAWDAVKLTAYATNLFDKDYFVYESGPGSVATLGDRREVGLQLDYRF